MRWLVEATSSARLQLLPYWFTRSGSDIDEKVKLKSAVIRASYSATTSSSQVASKRSSRLAGVSAELGPGESPPGETGPSESSPHPEATRTRRARTSQVRGPRCIKRSFVVIGTGL